MGMLSRLLALSSLLAFASALPTNKVREDTSLSKHPQPRFVHYYAILPARRQEAAKLTNRHKRETILEDDTVADDVAVPIQSRQLEEEEEPLQAVSVAGVNIENLLLDAERYIDADTLAEVDLSDPEAVLKLKEMVERQQARNAQFNFGYSVQVCRSQNLRVVIWRSFDAVFILYFRTALATPLWSARRRETAWLCAGNTPTATDTSSARVSPAGQKLLKRLFACQLALSSNFGRHGVRIQ